ncbi:MAG: hypothetical protein VCA55_06525 [Verrucomicrobiales bacterium]
MTEENQHALDFENWPPGEARDETDIGLRAYITRIPGEKLAGYDSSWTDGQVTGWDGNFKSDGGLMLVCCEREVEVPEFRRVLEEFIRFRDAR